MQHQRRLAAQFRVELPYDGNQQAAPLHVEVRTDVRLAVSDLLQRSSRIGSSAYQLETLMLNPGRSFPHHLVIRPKSKGLAKVLADGYEDLGQGVLATSYPWSGTFTSHEQIERYLSGSKILCLICGRMFRRLSGGHLIRKHALTNDAYRARYGIPLTRGLVCSETSELRSKIAKRPENLQNISRAWDMPQWRARQKIGGRGTRPAPTWFWECLKRFNTGRTKYANEDYEKVVLLMLQGRTASSACADPDAPSLSQFESYLKRNTGFAELFHARMEKAPFRVQANCHRLGTRFRTEVTNLYLRGNSVQTIALICDVSTGAVYNALIQKNMRRSLKYKRET